jgi:hypothetical protein
MASLVDQSWLPRAREARQRLAAAKHGEREKILNELASGHDVNSIRRLLRALTIHDRWTVSGRVESQRLLTAPQTIIEALSRWAEFDDEGAWKGFLDWEQNGVTVQALNAIVTEKRKAAGIDAGKTLEKDFRERLKPRILEIVSREIGDGTDLAKLKIDLTISRTNERHFGMPSVDYECMALDYVDDKARIRSIAVIIVGPYRGISLYSRKLSEWMQKALSLAWAYHLVILVVPENGQAREYRSWLAAFERNPVPADRRPHVRVVGVSLDENA